MAGNLTTLANALQWMGLTSDPQDMVARLIAAVSTQVQTYIGYQIAKANYTRTFNGQGTVKFFVPDIPLISVSSVTVDGMAIPAGSFLGNAQQSGYYNDSHCVGLIGYCFTRGFQNVTLSYTSGYATIPPDIEQATLDWIKVSWANQQMSGIPVGVASVSAGDTSINMGSKGGMVTDVTVVPMPSQIYAVLQPYQRQAMVSGM